MNSRRSCIAAATLEVSLLSELDLFFDVDYSFNVSTELHAPATAGIKDYL
jgi:hypothetical protein